jgi:two-component system LytT family response regulator
MLKAIAIDDEPIALDVIRTLAEQVPFLQMEGYLGNPLKALTILQQGEIDLLFLDIKMPGLSGTEFLKSLSSPPMVVFTTAYSEHAVQSFELNAIDYLLKPFSMARFLQACNKAHAQLEWRRPKVQKPLFIKSGYAQVRVEPKEIIYAESAGNYVKFVLQSGVLMSRLTMAQATELLSSKAFIQIHRSFIVGTSYVTKVDKHSVWLGNVELPIGAAYTLVVQAFLEGKGGHLIP